MKTNKKEVVNPNDTPLQKEIRKFLIVRCGKDKNDINEIHNPNIYDTYLDPPQLSGLEFTCTMEEIGGIDKNMIEDFPEISKALFKEVIDDRHDVTFIMNINTTPRTKVDKFFKSLGFKLVHQYKGNEGNVCTYIK